MPPTKIIWIFFCKIFENNCWFWKFVETKRSDIELTASQKYKPVACHFVRCNHLKDALSFLSLRLNNFPVVKFKPKLDCAFRHPVIHLRCLEWEIRSFFIKLKTHVQVITRNTIESWKFNWEVAEVCHSVSTRFQPRGNFQTYALSWTFIFDISGV